MHVRGLESDERPEVRRLLENELGQEPRVDETVVCIDENPTAAGVFAPAGNLRNPRAVLFALRSTRGWARRVDVYTDRLEHLPLPRLSSPILGVHKCRPRSRARLTPTAPRPGSPS